jgi:hypothetical protein
MIMRHLLAPNRFKTVVTLVTLIVVALAASPVSASPPTTTPFSFSITTTVPAGDSLCPFDVQITATGDGVERVFTDRHGQVTRIASNFIEQDTFSANGHQLVGDPFRNVQQALFDEDGNVVHVYEVGVIERVPLPNGVLFLSAGRLDFVEHDFNFVFTPDQGHSGDLEAFCAALAP